jgi:hypothetical protein
MKKNSLFSDSITQLTHVWLNWMKNNTICKDESLSFKRRREAADECEALINKRDRIVASLDSFFSAS